MYTCTFIIPSKNYTYKLLIGSKDCVVSIANIRKEGVTFLDIDKLNQTDRLGLTYLWN